MILLTYLGYLIPKFILFEMIYITNTELPVV